MVINQKTPLSMIGIGALWVLVIVAIAITDPIGTSTQKVTSFFGLYFYLIGMSAIGASFNYRYRNAPLTLPGRVYNYLTAGMSFCAFLIGLPLLWLESPVILMALCTASIVVLISLRIRNESLMEGLLASAVFWPLIARLLFGWFSPARESGFWSWGEIIITPLLCLAVILVNKRAESIFGASERNLWIWVHSINTVFLVAILLALMRGGEKETIAAVRNKQDFLVGAAMTAAAQNSSKLSESDRALLQKMAWFSLLGCGCGLVFLGGLERILSMSFNSFNDPLIFGSGSIGLWGLMAKSVTETDRFYGLLVSSWMSGLVLFGTILVILF